MPIYDIIVCLVLGIPLIALFAVEVLGTFARYHPTGFGAEITIAAETTSNDGNACRLHPCGLGLGRVPDLGCNLTD